MGIRNPKGFYLVTKMNSETREGPLFKVHTTAVVAMHGEVIWYRRNGDPGKLEESFKITGQQNQPQNVFSGGRPFEQ